MTAVRPLRRVLIANRGEIAVRIARSLREAGIWVIAVYSEADRDALHVRVADQAVCIGGAAASQSYLVPERLLEAAAATQACAIHPGYGFLAENAAFSETCEKAGLVFIGPTGASIRAMGDKSAARELAQEADVPVVPGHRDVSDADLERVAKEVGFPLLLKPSAGGGGKGMHRVESAARLVESARAARREARASFGDDRLIVERYVHPARHIEIQVFADGRGEVLALGERECSLQRRHQKVVEECPSPVLLDEQRQAMCADAIKLARAVDYRGAGTVEFLLGPDGRYYFLEMNTRLQVEHPVTEMVYGVDLVRAQIAVAEGRGLPEVLRQAKPRGAAIEVRLYAEAPERGFLPTAGVIHKFRAPRGPGVRVDAAIDDAGEVSPNYDPMIAKLIVWGADREEARQKLALALRETGLLGLESNLAFLREMVESSWFAEADFHTRLIEELAHAQKLAQPRTDLPLDLIAVAARALVRTAAAKQTSSADAAPSGPFDRLGAFRLFEGGGA